MATKKASWKIFSTWVPIVVALLAGIGFAIQYFFFREENKSTAAPIQSISAKQVNAPVNAGSGQQTNNFNSVSNNVNVKAAGKVAPTAFLEITNNTPQITNVSPYRHGDDTIALLYTYKNTGNGYVKNLIQTCFSLYIKDGQLFKNTPMTTTSEQSQLAPNEVNTTMAYIHKPELTSTQFIYIKLQFTNQTGTPMPTMRRIYIYESYLFGHQLPMIQPDLYDTVKKILIHEKVW